MFCPSCGSEYTVELKYCNRCGANLNTGTNQPQVIQVNLTKPTLIIGIVLTLLTLGGFGALIGGALALSTVVRGDDFLAVPVFGMMFICIIDILLIRQLSKIISASLKASVDSEIKSVPAPSQFTRLDRHSTAQLTPAPSVTENTTRFFEPTYRQTPEPVPRDKVEK